MPSDIILVKKCAEYFRNREGFFELLQKYGANYTLTKSNIKESESKTLMVMLFNVLDCILIQN